MDEDGSAKSGRARLARGTKPNAAIAVGGVPSGAGRAPAQSICEAVEQLIEAQEADEAVAEWMRGGG